MKTFLQNVANVYEQVGDLFGPETIPIAEPLPTRAVNIPVDLTDVLAPEILYPGDRCPFEQPEQILPVNMPPLITVFPSEEGHPVFDSVMASTDGTFTSEELAELQRIADKYNTEIHVVGSRAAGEGRNINTDLPVGKGDGTRSDIDVRIDGQVNIDSRGTLADEILNIGGGGVASIVNEWLPTIPSREPVIIIAPR